MRIYIYIYLSSSLVHLTDHFLLYDLQFFHPLVWQCVTLTFPLIISPPVSSRSHRFPATSLGQSGGPWIFRLYLRKLLISHWLCGLEINLEIKILKQLNKILISLLNWQNSITIWKLLYIEGYLPKHSDFVTNYKRILGS